jgi:hypothetical protein
MLQKQKQALVNFQFSKLKREREAKAQTHEMIANVTAMMGVIQKMVANGLLIPSSGFIISVCVNAHLSPPRALAEKTMSMPGRSAETEV